MPRKLPRKSALRKTTTSGKNQFGRVRIIAGRWRGRWIEFEEETGLRPTGDRIRETVFNWLQNRTQSSRCLDLYAGSGALGLEAASRGAASVTLVDSNARVAARLEAESKKLDARNIHVVHSSACAFLAGIKRQGKAVRFDTVFVDPPFDDGCQLATLQQCIDAEALTEGARVYVEAPASASNEEALPAGFSLLKSKQTGNVQYLLIEYHNIAPGPDLRQASNTSSG